MPHVLQYMPLIQNTSLLYLNPETELFAMKITPLAFAFLLALFMSACQSADKPATGAPQAATLPEDNGDFIQKISPDNGITFKHYIGDHHMDNLVETVGGGAVFLD